MTTFLAILSLVLLFAAPPTPTSSDLLPAANAARAVAGSPPLAVCWSLEVDAMARAHAVLAGDPNRIVEADHAGFADPIFALGYTWAAENLGFVTKGAVNDPAMRALIATAWEHSPGHYANLVNPNERCFGSAELPEPGGGTLYLEEFAGWLPSTR